MKDSRVEDVWAAPSSAAAGHQPPAKYTTAVPLGAGATGEVFEAYDTILKRPVALKWLRRDDPALARRMLREARAQASVDHPNVCKVYDIGELDGRPYIAMQLVRGETLDRAARVMSLEHKLGTLRVVAEAVHAAHVVGLIHRDLKPANILVEETDAGGFVPYVLDFGIVHEQGAAGLTATGELIGTPGYMAPEQARGDAHHVDRRSDVFSLGAILYEILGGAPAFPGRGRLAILVKVLHDSPRPLRALAPSLPLDVETIVMRCLEREPAHRYESARALADDLSRFLKGEPILARPRGQLERIGTAIRRHKGVSALLAAAGVALAAAGGATLHARRSAAERARVAQEFGQDAERMSAWMRQAYLSRLHDTRPERELLLQWMHRVEAQMATLDSVAAAAGHYALGRAHHSLHDDAQARAHLETSWADGHRTPAVAQALGRVLGALYRRELGEAERIRDADVRRAKLDELERLYKAPALRFLQVARDSPVEAADLLHAEIAYYEKRYEDAWRLAALARRRQPWLYEAELLRGDTAHALAEQERAQGHAAAALARYQDAEGAYREAAETGASDATTHERLCRLTARRMETLYFDRGGDIAPLAGRLVEECGRSLQADPGRPQPSTLISAGYTRLAQQQMKRGADPYEALERAIAAARSALGVDPQSAGALRRLGDAYASKAEHEKAHGREASASLAASVESLERAVAIDADDPGAFNSLGLAHWEAADSLLARGQDPQAAFTAAAAAFRRATQLLPTYVHALSNLGAVHKNRALDAMARGHDPAAAFAAGIESLERAIAAGPSYSYAYNNLGNIHLHRGQHQLEHGEDPEPALREALRYHGLASGMNRTWPYPRANAAQAHHALARHALDRGRDPAPAIRDALSALAAGLALKADMAEAHVEAARVRLTEARHALSKRRSPEPAFAEAARAAGRALRINPTSAVALRAEAEVCLARSQWHVDSGRSPRGALAEAESVLERAAAVSSNDAETHLLQARAKLLGAEWIVAQGRPAALALGAGLEQAEAALALNPASAAAFAVRGRLHLLDARSARERPRSRQAAARASAALQRAVELNGWLGPEMRPLLAKALELQSVSGS